MTTVGTYGHMEGDRPSTINRIAKHFYSKSKYFIHETDKITVIGNFSQWIFSEAAQSPTPQESKNNFKNDQYMLQS